MEKAPYLLVVGDKEKDADLVSVESRDQGDGGSDEGRGFWQRDSRRSRGKESLIVSQGDPFGRIVK